MNIYIDIYWVRAKIFTENHSLSEMIKKYYEPFIVNPLNKYDLSINLERYNYLWKKNFFTVSKDFINFWDSVKINESHDKYFFSQQEISWLIDFTNKDRIDIQWKLIPNKIRHWVNILLQWFTRIDKYYNRFIIKTCIHDIVFILLEQKLKSCLLHATAVTNWKKTYLFTWLWWSGKSTMASSFSKLKWYTILSDNYAIVSWKKIYPFPELPRITKWTQGLLWINLNHKADWTKDYLDNNLSNLEKEYIIDKIFICSYWNNFELKKIQNKDYLFEVLFSINNYTKEFPEYLNLSLLSIIKKFNTNRDRINNLSNIIDNNNFYLLSNNRDLENNLNKILNV